MTWNDERLGELSDVCERLRAEPLFHLSLRSKELFHSDFLAWFVGAAPDAATAVFAEWAGKSAAGTGVKEPSVERERDHLDLRILLPGRAPLVIENKVFSLPDEDQLAKYGKKISSGTACVLLSLTDPRWDGGHRSLGEHDWAYRSYGGLADQISTAVREHRPSQGFHADLIAHYAELCRLLVRVRDLCGVKGADLDEPVQLPDEALRRVRSVRIHDAVQKLRARQIEQTLRKELAPDLPAEVDLSSGYAARARTPLLQAFVPVADATRPREERDQIGWQFEGEQFRLAVRVGDPNPTGKKDPARRAAREAYVEERYGSFFDFDFAGVGTAPHPAPKKSWNGYEPDFVYRYRRVGDITVGRLVELARHYTKGAAEQARGRPPTVQQS